MLFLCSRLRAVEPPSPPFPHPSRIAFERDDGGGAGALWEVRDHCHRSPDAATQDQALQVSEMVELVSKTDTDSCL